MNLVGTEVPDEKLSLLSQILCCGFLVVSYW